MDQIDRCRNAIHEILSRYVANDRVEGHDGVQTYCAFDDDHNQYLVVRSGWIGQRRIKGIVLHLRIDDGKVWIEENSTDQTIADDLVARGISKEDIVLGFIHPSLRQDL